MQQQQHPAPAQHSYASALAFIGLLFWREGRLGIADR